MATVKPELSEISLLNEGECLHATITRIEPFARFSSGWIGQPFLYESPAIAISCSTDVGELQLETTIQNLPKSGLLSFIENAPCFDPSSRPYVTLTELCEVDKSVYISVSDSRQRAAIDWEPVECGEDAPLLLRTDPDNFYDVPDEDTEQRKFATGTEHRSNKWMNTLLTTEYERYSAGSHGWLETSLTYEGEDDGLHYLTTDYSAAYWAFDATFEGLQNLHSFLEQLNIPPELGDIDGETIWIKPVRDLHHTNRPHDDRRISATEAWVAAPRPLSQETRTTTLQKIKNILTFPLFSSSPSVEVSSSSISPSRRAKISNTKHVPPPPEKEAEVLTTPH